MTDPISHVLRAIAEHLSWAFADDWFTLRGSRVGAGFAEVRLESAATALVLVSEVRDGPAVYITLGPAGADREDLFPLVAVSRARGVDVQAEDVLTPDTARFLAAHLGWFDAGFGEPDARRRTLDLIRREAQAEARARFGPTRPDLAPGRGPEGGGRR